VDVKQHDRQTDSFRSAVSFLISLVFHGTDVSFRSAGSFSKLDVSFRSAGSFGKLDVSFRSAGSFGKLDVSFRSAESLTEQPSPSSILAGGWVFLRNKCQLSVSSLPLINIFHHPGSWLDQPSAGRCCGLIIVSLRSASLFDGLAMGLWSVGPLLEKTHN